MNGNLLSLNEAFNCEPGPLTRSFEILPNPFLDTDLDPRVFAAIMGVFGIPFMKWLLGENNYNKLLTIWPAMLMWHITIDTLKKIMRFRSDIILVLVDSFNRRVSVIAEVQESLLQILDPATRSERLNRVKIALQQYQECVNVLCSLESPKFDGSAKANCCELLQLKVVQHENRFQQASAQPLGYVLSAEALAVVERAIADCSSLKMMKNFMVQVHALEAIYSNIAANPKILPEVTQSVAKYLTNHWQRIVHLLSLPELPPANEISVDVGVVVGHVMICSHLCSKC